MKEGCEYCEKIKKSTFNVFEDDKVIAMLDDNPAAPGHLLVMPKEHYPIIEQVPDYIINHLFQVINKVSVVLFENLRLQGTNILINNGIAAGQEHAHFVVNIIPRKEKDNLDFQWQPKQLNEEEMSTIELELKSQTASIGEFEKEKEALVKTEEPKEIPEDEDNYLIKQLRRLP